MLLKYIEVAGVKLYLNELYTDLANRVNKNNFQNGFQLYKKMYPSLYGGKRNVGFGLDNDNSHLSVSVKNYYSEDFKIVRVRCIEAYGEDFSFIKWEKIEKIENNFTVDDSGLWDKKWEYAEHYGKPFRIFKRYNDENISLTIAWYEKWFQKLVGQSCYVRLTLKNGI